MVSLKIRILLAEDHAIVRQGLRALLERQPDFEVVGEVERGDAVLAAVERLRPDVVVMDIMMPGITGLAATRQLKAKFRRVQVLILSMYDDISYVAGALRVGAAGYVLKDESCDLLDQGVRAVAKGERFISPVFTAEAIAAYQERMQGEALDPYDTLTRREKDVFRMVADGYTSAQIAETLSISRRTVEAHRSRVLQKLGIVTQSDLVRYALRRGIISLEFR